MSSKTFAHVINPVLVKPTSDLYVAQPITFETMRAAQQFAAGKIETTLFSVHYPEDMPIVPPDFEQLPLLDRSVLDFGQFQQPRRLPLLRDILDRLYQATDAEYLIYSNVDIGLQPHFYLTIAQFIEQGHDAFVINRRTISARHTSPAQVPLMLAEVGEAHRGWDCFVFRRDMVPKFRLGAVCVGATRVGLALLANLVGNGRCFHEFTNEHLTFHIGDDRQWLNPAFKDYGTHNTTQLMQVLQAIEAENGPFGKETIPGSFLYRKRTFGRFYEFWSQNVYLPAGLSQLINKFFRR